MGVFSRAYAQFYKNLLTLRGEPFRIIDVIFWPLVGVFSVTFLLDYLHSPAEVFSIVIAGVAGWRLLYIITLDIANTYATDHWSKSSAYLFATPVTPVDFVLGGAGTGLLKGIFVSILIGVTSGLLYTFPLPSLANVLTGAAILTVFAVAVGMLILSLMYFIGPGAFASAFAVPDLLSLLCGAYYPVSVLPAWLQPIANVLPATFGFAYLRADWQPVTFNPWFVLALTLAWLAGAYLIHAWAFKFAKRNGKVAKLG